MSNETKPEGQKAEQAFEKKKLIVLVAGSLLALLLVAATAYFVLTKIKTKAPEGIASQEQFEGSADISSQLQIECQNSAQTVAQSKSPEEAEIEYKKHLENCRNVFFAFDFETTFRREGVYADLVVDIANQLAVKNKDKALELLKEIRSQKEWDFSLGPVSCSSGGVLDAYIESYAIERQPICFSKEDLKTKLIPSLQTKNFSLLSQLTRMGEVVWLGIPDSDVGCPEKVASAVQTLKSLTQGAVIVEEAVSEHAERPQTLVNIKLSDKEVINLVFSLEKECAHLTTILVPNSEPVE